MDHELVLTFEYADAERARRIERSLWPEVGDIEGDRTRASLERTAGTLRVRVAAADLVALRAGLNTWTTLVAVAERVAGPSAA